MNFTNCSGGGVKVAVYNDTDQVALVPRWRTVVEPGASVEYRPRAGDTRRYRAAVEAVAGAVAGGSTPSPGGKQWVEGLRDQGQSIDIDLADGAIVVTTTLDPDHDPANWMGNLGVAIAERDLRQIIIPGTHDSGSYSADMTPAVRTQNRDFDFQLRNGIRYFDLRVTYSTDKPALGFKANTFYLCHNCVSARELEFEPQLEAVAAFAEAHRREIILFDFHELTEGIAPYPIGGAAAMREADRAALLAMVHRHLGPRMIPADAGLRIGDIWSSGRNVVVFFPYDDPTVWAPDRMQVLWDTYSSSSEISASVAKKIESLERFLEARLPEVDSSQVFNNAATGIWNVAIRLSAEEVNRHLVTWLERWHDQPNLRNKLNVVSVDFFQYSEVVPTAIRLNRLPV